MAVLSAEELALQAALIYAGNTYEVLLLNKTSGTYQDSTAYADILSDEVTPGDGGYSRLSFTYAVEDIGSYSNGIPLDEKVAIFAHDGSSTDITFNHIALVRNDSGSFTLVAIENIGERAILSAGQTATININLLFGKP
jgi:hypothetical protein